MNGGEMKGSMSGTWILIGCLALVAGGVVGLVSYGAYFVYGRLKSQAASARPMRVRTFTGTPLRAEFRPGLPSCNEEGVLGWYFYIELDSAVTIEGWRGEKRTGPQLIVQAPVALAPIYELRQGRRRTFEYIATRRACLGGEEYPVITALRAVRDSPP